VKLSLIRFFGIARFHTIRLQARPRNPRHTSPSAVRAARLRCDASHRCGGGAGLGVPAASAVVRRWHPASPSLNQVPRTELVPWLPDTPVPRADVPPGRLGPAGISSGFRGGCGARHRYYGRLRLPNARPRFLCYPARPLVPVVSAFNAQDRPGGASGISSWSFDIAVDSYGLRRLDPRLWRQEADEALASSRAIPVSS
jgi:hypothetical protein